MKSFLALIVITLWSFSPCFGQIAHDVEIYSEDGDPFILILDGRVMNEEPASTVQVINTNKDYMRAKIVFEDSTIAPIEKRNFQIADPGEGTEKSPVTLVCKIVQKKNGKYKLRFQSRSHKKIQDNSTDVIIVQPNPKPVNGRVRIEW